MKKQFLFIAVAIATLTTVKAQNLISDGTFETTASGNFTLTGGVVIGTTRSVWGGVDNTGGTPAPSVGVTTGGATGNCAFVTPGTTASSTTKGFLYQRLPTPSNISKAKTYRLTVKLKASTTNVKGYLYIKTRGKSSSGSNTDFFAVRADYASGETFAWAKYITSIATSWTEYSQSFVFLNSVSTPVISTTSPSSPAVEFTDADLDDLIFGFYSAGGTVYVDDVQLVDITTGLSTLKSLDNFIVVKDRQISINDYCGELVSVYSITGQRVIETNKPIFSLDRSGIYIVKMGNKTQRVIIK